MATEAIWRLKEGALIWDVQPGQRHQDHYEMSGLYCDCIIEYGVDHRGELMIGRSCYFPTLRTIPNDTHATLELRVSEAQVPALMRNGQPIREYPLRFCLDGTLTVQSRTDADVQIKRQFFPASESRCGLELVTLTAEKATQLHISQPSDQILGYTLGTKGTYVSRLRHTASPCIRLEAGESYCYTVALSADIGMEPGPLPDGQQALQLRYGRIDALCDRTLVLDTGIEELDAMFRFAKLRAGESIFETLSGKFHSPGGRTYYAAVWCNDQVEYAGPYFAMTGDPMAVEASINAYRAYVPFMADNYGPLPSSVIAEGLDIWNGAGDRGDAAMYLYGASLFCLFLGDRQVARELYGPIRWCAEYCHRRTGPEGVVCSDTDELERRIPTDGYANLSTSCLCYGGLLAAAKLAQSLDDAATAQCYRRRATDLAAAIEAYFGAQLHGYETYRYSKGFDTLRSWICLPLCMGLESRAQGTLDAMLSPWLWTEEGMLSCELSQDNRDSAIWDRSTLYGFKAAFAAGQAERVMQPLLRYCRKRLVCDRVPYAVEAYPEGEKRHLSGESALFARVITEGILAIRPESLTGFSFVPALPREMPHLYLSGLHIAGQYWQIRLERETWSVFREDRLWASGKTDAKRVYIH